MAERTDNDLPDPAAVTTLPELAAVLRALRRREARARHGRELTYNQLAERTGASPAAIGYYLTGAVLPPTDRLDSLVLVLGANRGEVGALGSARDRVADQRRSVPAEPGPPIELLVPRELPAAPRNFVGRDQELVRLDALAFEDAKTAALVAVTGMAGIGKTALALRWAHEVADVFRDGQLYIDLHGYDPTGPVDPGEVLTRFLHSLGVRSGSVALDPVEREAQFRTLVAKRRLLIVLDNAGAAEQVRPLLSGSPLCTVLVTSRHHLGGLVSADGARRVPLDVLPARDATALLRRLLGDWVGVDPAAAAELVHSCGGLPLALRVAAEVMTRQPSVPLAEFVNELRSVQSGLHLPGTGEWSARPVLSWAYRSLSAGSARMFTLLGCAPRSELGITAIASLVGLDRYQTRPLLAELTHAHLLSETASLRYALHDVVGDFAGELATTELDQSDRDMAIQRLLDHYLGSAVRADRLLDPFRQPIETTEIVEGVLIAELESVEEAMAWFAAEHDTMLVTFRFALQHAHPEHAWQLAWAMATHLDRGGYWHDWSALSTLALDLPHDPSATARMHANAAKAAERLKLVETAREHYGQALELLEQVGDTRGRAAIHTNMATLSFLSGATHDVLAHASAAFVLYEQLDDKAGQGRALNTIGHCHATHGEYPAALQACGASLALAWQTGDLYSEAAIRDSLGFIHHKMGERRQAIEHYRSAVPLFGELGHRWHQATCWTSLGDVYSDDGQPEAAVEAWRSALDILEDLGHPDAALVRARLQNGERSAD